MNIKQALRLGAQILSETGRDIPVYLEANLLMRHVLTCSSEKLVMNRNAEVSSNQLDQFLNLINIRAKESTPIAYLTGKKDFYLYEFIVSPDVLIPRPDSEVLVDEAISIFESTNRDISILEFGVGSGCLLLTLLKKLPKSKGTGVDISPGAIEIAKQNYNALDIKNEINFIASDWNQINFDQKFDLIISNPPYISMEEMDSLSDDVKNHEPLTALQADNNGLKCYEDLMPIIAKYLQSSGYAILEFGYKQSEEVIEIAMKNGLYPCKILKDLGGHTRGVVLQLKNN